MLFKNKKSERGSFRVDDKVYQFSNYRFETSDVKVAAYLKSHVDWVAPANTPSNFDPATAGATESKETGKITPINLPKK